MRQSVATKLLTTELLCYLQVSIVFSITLPVCGCMYARRYNRVFHPEPYSVKPSNIVSNVYQNLKKKSLIGHSNFKYSTFTDMFICIETETEIRPLKLTSSGSQCSGQYASYWNAFLLLINFTFVQVYSTNVYKIERFDRIRLRMKTSNVCISRRRSPKTHKHT